MFTYMIVSHVGADSLQLKGSLFLFLFSESLVASLELLSFRIINSLFREELKSQTPWYLLALNRAVCSMQSPSKPTHKGSKTLSHDGSHIPHK